MGALRRKVAGRRMVFDMTTNELHRRLLRFAYIARHSTFPVMGHDDHITMSDVRMNVIYELEGMTIPQRSRFFIFLNMDEEITEFIKLRVRHWFYFRAFEDNAEISKKIEWRKEGF